MSTRRLPASQSVTIIVAAALGYGLLVWRAPEQIVDWDGGFRSSSVA